MSFGFSRVYDDRGVTANYRDPMSHGSELGPTEQATINRRKPGSHWWLIALLTISLGIQLISLFQLSISAMITRIAVTVTLAIIAWFLVILPIRRTIWARHWISRYKDLGRCPACQYSLSAIEAASDGCTICPECGGAWKLTK